MVRNGIPMRVDPELNRLVEQLREKNAISRRLATKIIADEFRKMKIERPRLEVEF